ncbi:MAG: hypothetical protein HY341_00500 [Candidatus Kerfeldbacteria bacterium]|nr:hypothetical protein [Candidatus Kerfeldbacteria bacterium]
MPERGSPDDRGSLPSEEASGALSPEEKEADDAELGDQSENPVGEGRKKETSGERTDKSDPNAPTELEPIQVLTREQTAPRVENDTLPKEQQNIEQRDVFHGSDGEQVDAVHITDGPKEGRIREHWFRVHRQIAVQLGKEEPTDVTINLEHFGMILSQGRDRKNTSASGESWVHGTWESEEFEAELMELLGDDDLEWRSVKSTQKGDSEFVMEEYTLPNGATLRRERIVKGPDEGRAYGGLVRTLDLKLVDGEKKIKHVRLTMELRVVSKVGKQGTQRAGIGERSIFGAVEKVSLEG